MQYTFTDEELETMKAEYFDRGYQTGVTDGKISILERENTFLNNMIATVVGKVAAK